MLKKYIKTLLIAIPVALILSQLIPALLYSDLSTSLKIQYHSFQTRNLERIQISDDHAQGNTVINTNNYGHGVKGEDHYYFVENHLNLVQTTKDFQNKQYLIEQSGGTGINRLNKVDDWIFFSQGKSYNRIKTDGSQQETIFQMGYPLDVHLLGNWIYFRNFSDRSMIYRMDVNGQNLERLVNQSVTDLTLYDDRLYYSYQEDEAGWLKSVDLEGKDLRVEMNREVKDLTVWEGYYYFMDYEDDRLYRKNIYDDESPQLLVDEKVSTYALTENGIYYALHSPDVGYPGDGLYKMALDGSDKILLMDTKRVEGLCLLDHWLLFMSSDESMLPNQKKLDLRRDEILEMAQ